MKHALLASLSLLLPAAASADTFDVFDTFVTASGTAHVEITDCGDGSPCGRVIWFDSSDLPDGETMETFIGQNGEQVFGSLILKDFKRKSKDWRGGTIYDSENDKTYAARLKRLASGQLELKGCVGMFCQTQIWEQIATE